MKDLLKYDPHTGYVTLIKNVKGRKKSIDCPLGTLNKDGYLQTEVKGKQYKIHRLAWYLYYGKWPESQIDHINKDKRDNRISNLRCGVSLNQHNRDIKPGITGLSGAYWSPRKNKFYSAIKINKKNKFLGYFRCATAAHLAYLSAKKGVLDG